MQKHEFENFYLHFNANSIFLNNILKYFLKFRFKLFMKTFVLEHERFDDKRHKYAVRERNYDIFLEFVLSSISPTMKSR
jgi:hypothetical protein